MKRHDLCYKNNFKKWSVKEKWKSQKKVKVKEKMTFNDEEKM